MLSEKIARRLGYRFISFILACALILNDTSFAFAETNRHLSPPSKFNPIAESDQNSSFREKAAFRDISILIGKYLRIGISEHTLKKHIKNHVASIQKAMEGDPILKGVAIDELTYNDKENAFFLPLYHNNKKAFICKYYISGNPKDADIVMPLGDGTDVYIKTTAVSEYEAAPEPQRTSPAGSIPSVFAFLHDNNITTPEAALTAREIAARLGRSYETIKYDLRALHHHLRLIEKTNAQAAGAEAIYYVTENINTNADKIAPILARFVKTYLRPTKACLELVREVFVRGLFISPELAGHQTSVIESMQRKLDAYSEEISRYLNAMQDGEWVRDPVRFSARVLSYYKILDEINTYFISNFNTYCKPGTPSAERYIKLNNMAAQMKKDIGDIKFKAERFIQNGEFDVLFRPIRGKKEELQATRDPQEHYEELKELFTAVVDRLESHVLINIENTIDAEYRRYGLQTLKGQIAQLSDDIDRMKANIPNIDIESILAEQFSLAERAEKILMNIKNKIYEVDIKKLVGKFEMNRQLSRPDKWTQREIDKILKEPSARSLPESRLKSFMCIIEEATPGRMPAAGSGEDQMLKFTLTQLRIMLNEPDLEWQKLEQLTVQANRAWENLGSVRRVWAEDRTGILSVHYMQDSNGWGRIPALTFLGVRSQALTEQILFWSINLMLVLPLGSFWATAITWSSFFLLHFVRTKNMPQAPPWYKILAVASINAIALIAPPVFGAPQLVIGFVLTTLIHHRLNMTASMRSILAVGDMSKSTNIARPSFSKKIAAVLAGITIGIAALMPFGLTENIKAVKYYLLTPIEIRNFSEDSSVIVEAKERYLVDDKAAYVPMLGRTATARDIALYTDSVATCAALAIDDPSGNKHYLAHFTPACDIEEIRDSIAKNFANFAGLKIYILEGSYARIDDRGIFNPGAMRTIKNIYAALQDLGMADKAMFVPANYSDGSRLLLYQGKLFFPVRPEDSIEVRSAKPKPPQSSFNRARTPSALEWILFAQLLGVVIQSRAKKYRQFTPEFPFTPDYIQGIAFSKNVITDKKEVRRLAMDLNEGMLQGGYKPEIDRRGIPESLKLDKCTVFRLGRINIKCFESKEYYDDKPVAPGKSYYKKYILSISRGNTVIGHGIISQYYHVADMLAFRFSIHGNAFTKFLRGIDFSGMGYGKEALSLIMAMSASGRLFEKPFNKFWYNHSREDEMSTPERAQNFRRMKGLLKKAGYDTSLAFSMASRQKPGSSDMEAKSTAQYTGRTSKETERIKRSLEIVSGLKRRTPVVWIMAMYNETRRLLPKSWDNPFGEDALRKKVRESQMVKSVNPNYQWRIIAVDDGTPDTASARTVRELWNQIQEEYRQLGEPLDPNQVKVMEITPEEKARMNSRKGGAILRGLNAAVDEGWADYIGYTDVDISTDLRQVGILLEPLDNGDADVALGSRRAKGGEATNVPISGIISSLLYNWCVRIILPPLRKIKDTQRAFKLFKRNVLRKILPQAKDTSFAFDTELLLLAKLEGFKTSEVAIAWFDSAEASTFNALANSFKAILQLLKQRQHIFTHKPAAKEIFMPIAKSGKAEPGSIRLKQARLFKDIYYPAVKRALTPDELKQFDRYMAMKEKYRLKNRFKKMIGDPAFGIFVDSSEFIIAPTVKEWGVGADTPLIDLGSGLGSFGFLLAAVFGFRNVTMVEWDPEKVAYSKALLRALEEKGFIAPGTVTIKQGDFIAEDLSRYGAAYYFQGGAPDAVEVKIPEKLKEMDEGSVFILQGHDGFRLLREPMPELRHHKTSQELIHFFVRQAIAQNAAAMALKNAFSEERLLAVREDIKPYIATTPLFYLPAVSARAGKPVFIKDESRQKGNSFKTRGVTYEVFAAIERAIKERPETLKTGLKIVTQSMGNHGIAMIQAVTSAIKKFSKEYPGLEEDIRKIEPVVFSINDISPVKLRSLEEDALADYRKYVGNAAQGMININFANYDQSKRARQKYIEEHGQGAIYMEHGGVEVMQGHASAGIEIAEQLWELGIDDAQKVCLITSVGAGGPTGIAAGLKALRKNVSAIMVQTPRYGAGVKSFESGKMEQNNGNDSPYTIEVMDSGTPVRLIYEDGIAVEGLESEQTLKLVRRFFDYAFLADPKRALNEAAPLLLSDLDTYYSERADDEGVMGGTTAIAADVLLAGVADKAIKDSDVIVLVATEGNVNPLLTRHTRQRMAKAGNQASLLTSTGKPGSSDMEIRRKDESRKKVGFVEVTNHEEACGIIKELCQVTDKKIVLINFDDHEDAAKNNAPIEAARLGCGNWVSYALQENPAIQRYAWERPVWFDDIERNADIFGRMIEWPEHKAAEQNNYVEQQIRSTNGFSSVVNPDEAAIVTIDLDYFSLFRAEPNNKSYAFPSMNLYHHIPSKQEIERSVIKIAKYLRSIPRIGPVIIARSPDYTHPACIKFTMTMIRKHFAEEGIDVSMSVKPGSSDMEAENEPEWLKREVKEYIQAIKNDFFAALARHEIFDMPGNGCKIASRVLAKHISERFGIPIGGDGAVRLEIMAGHVKNRHGYHEWLGLYTNEDIPSVYIDARQDVFDPAYANTIIIEPYQAALKKYDVKELRAEFFEDMKAALASEGIDSADIEFGITYLELLISGGEMRGNRLANLYFDYRATERTRSGNIESLGTDIDTKIERAVADMRVIASRFGRVRKPGESNMAVTKPISAQRSRTGSWLSSLILAVSLVLTPGLATLFVAANAYAQEQSTGLYTNRYPLYETSFAYITLFQNSSLTNDFYGFTRSYQGDVPTNHTSAIGEYGASSYDLSILGRIQLYNNNSNIIDTFTANWELGSDIDNQVFYFGNNYTNETGDAIQGLPFNFIRILGRGEEQGDWWNIWDWSVESGAAAELVNLALDAHRKTGNTRYLNFATGLADTLLMLQDSDGGFRFAPIGVYHASGNRFFWNLKSTEKNERILSAMENLYAVTSDDRFAQATVKLKGWLKSMYNPQEHLFHTAASYNGSEWVKSPLGTYDEYFASDVTAMAPIEWMFQDTFFGATQAARDAEVEAMFYATDTRLAFKNAEGQAIFYRFSGSQADDYGSAEFTAQMAVAFLRAAQNYSQRDPAKCAQYLWRYQLLTMSLQNNFFKPAIQDPSAKVAPYASYLDGSRAGGVPTGTGYNTEYYEAAHASVWLSFALSGFDPEKIDGGGGIPLTSPIITGIGSATNTDMLITIKDPPGVSRYDIYYKNNMLELFWHIAESDHPVSGSGITQWRDDGTYTETHPKQAMSRFYRVGIASNDLNKAIVIQKTSKPGSSDMEAPGKPAGDVSVEVTIDAKNRIAIPARFTADLQAPFYLFCKAYDRSIAIYSKNEFEMKMRPLMGASMADAKSRDILRAIGANSAFIAAISTSRRFKIPSYMLKSIGATSGKLLMTKKNGKLELHPVPSPSTTAVAGKKPGSSDMEAETPVFHDVKEVSNITRLRIDRFKALLRLVEQSPEFSWQENGRYFAAYIEYDDIPQEFSVEPTAETRKTYPELATLDMPATDDYVPSMGLFGVIRLSIVINNGEPALWIREVQPSIGFRNIQPVEVRQKFYSWNKQAVEHIVRLAEQAGFKYFYASTVEELDDRYAKRLRMPIPNSNLKQNYLNPFRDKWKKVNAAIDGRKTRLWHREKSAPDATLQKPSSSDIETSDSVLAPETQKIFMKSVNNFVQQIDKFSEAQLKKMEKALIDNIAKLDEDKDILATMSAMVDIWMRLSKMTADPPEMYERRIELLARDAFTLSRILNENMHQHDIALLIRYIGAAGVSDVAALKNVKNISEIQVPQQDSKEARWLIDFRLFEAREKVAAAIASKLAKIVPYESGQIARGDAEELYDALAAKETEESAQKDLRRSISLPNIAKLLEKRIASSGLADNLKQELRKYVAGIADIKALEFDAILLPGSEGPGTIKSWLLGFNTMPRAPAAAKDKFLNELQTRLQERYPNTLGLSSQVLDKTASNHSCLEEYVFHEIICPYLGHKKTRIIQEMLFTDNYHAYIKGDAREGRKDGDLSFLLKEVIEEGAEERISEAADEQEEIKRPIENRLDKLEDVIEGLRDQAEDKVQAQALLHELRADIIALFAEIKGIEDAEQRQLCRLRWDKIAESWNDLQNETDYVKNPVLAGKIISALKEGTAPVERIDKVRAAFGLSQADFARKLGMDESDVNKYLASKADPSRLFIKNVIKLMRDEAGVDIDAGEILFGEKLFDILKKTDNLKDRVRLAREYIGLTQDDTSDIKELSALGEVSPVMVLFGKPLPEELKNTAELKDKILKIRVSLGLSPKEMAKKLALSPDVYYGYENGETRNIPLAVLRSMEDRANLARGTLPQDKPGSSDLEMSPEGRKNGDLAGKPARQLPFDTFMSQAFIDGKADPADIDDAMDDYYDWLRNYTLNGYIAKALYRVDEEAANIVFGILPKGEEIGINDKRPPYTFIIKDGAWKTPANPAARVWGIYFSGLESAKSKAFDELNQNIESANVLWLPVPGNEIQMDEVDPRDLQAVDEYLKNFKEKSLGVARLIASLPPNILEELESMNEQEAIQKLESWSHSPTEALRSAINVSGWKVYVLAGGYGKRVGATTEKPKPMFEVAGRPIYTYVLDKINGLGLKTIILTGFGATAMEESVNKTYGEGVFGFIRVSEPDGTGLLNTGNDFMRLKEKIREDPAENILIINSDDIYPNDNFIKEVLAKHSGTGGKTPDATVLTMRKESPGHFGRIIRDENGKFVEIVEHTRWSNRDTLKIGEGTAYERIVLVNNVFNIKEVNTNVIAFKKSALLAILDDMEKRDGGFYIAEALAEMVRKGIEVQAILLKDEDGFISCNTIQDIASAEAIVKTWPSNAYQSGMTAGFEQKPGSSDMETPDKTTTDGPSIDLLAKLTFKAASDLTTAEQQEVMKFATGSNMWRITGRSDRSNEMESDAMVAYLEEQPVAVWSFIWQGGDLARDEALDNGIYVAEELRGLSIGTRLRNELYEYLKERGYNRFIISNVDKTKEAQRFQEALANSKGVMMLRDEDGIINNVLVDLQKFEHTIAPRDNALSADAGIRHSLKILSENASRRAMDLNGSENITTGRRAIVQMMPVEFLTDLKNVDVVAKPSDPIVKNLIKKIRSDDISNMDKKPVRIDAKAGGKVSIYDGMHRIAALKALGVKQIPVLMVYPNNDPANTLPFKTINYAAEARITALEKQLYNMARSNLGVPFIVKDAEAAISLASQIDAADPYTLYHSKNVVAYSMAIAKEMALHAPTLSEFTNYDEFEETLKMAALLHDLGKIEVSLRILNKPGDLTPEELEIISRHPDAGVRILKPLAELESVLPGIQTHHERYDGSGYPSKIKGGAIPLIGRIIAVADAFDAMTTDRAYQKAKSAEVAIVELKSSSGILFDPTVVEAFLGAYKSGAIRVTVNRAPQNIAPARTSANLSSFEVPASTAPANILPKPDTLLDRHVRRNVTAELPTSHSARIEAIKFADTIKLIEAARVTQPIILALGTDWIKSYKRGTPHYNELNRLISAIRNYCTTQGIIFINKDDGALMIEIEKQRQNAPNAKVIVLADKESIAPEKAILAALRNDKNAFLAAVDSSELDETCYVRLADMLRLALELGFKELFQDKVDLTNPNIDIGALKDFRNVYIFLPHAERIPIYDNLRALYRVQEFA